MNDNLQKDRENIAEILKIASDMATRHVAALPEAFVAPEFSPIDPVFLPENGRGARGAMQMFSDRYADYLPAMPGPNFFGYVIGGVTPAALAGDWLTSAFDQNAFGNFGSADRQIEREAVRMAADLLGLGAEFEGVMASGASMATYTALAAAREWAGAKQGVDPGRDGVFSLKMNIYSGTAHVSVYKALSMLGLGRSAMTPVGMLPHREAADLDALEKALQSSGAPSVVVAAMCTVDSGDYDDLATLAQLKEKYGFWLHVDGAIAAPAACLPELADRFIGLSAADSLTLDCHKWFNTPYDGAITLCKQPEYQYRALAQTTGDSGAMPDHCPHVHLAAEGSRRLRALPLWMSLLAYGKEGYADIFRRNIADAKLAYDLLSASGKFTMLGDAKFNTICFTLPGADMQAMNDFALRVRRTGKTFLNTTLFRGEIPAARACFSNWSTEEENVRAGMRAVIESV